MYTFDTTASATSLTGPAVAGLATPMELLGGHPGISVIDPSTVLTRLWYFDGKFLRAEDFRRDQEYVRSLVALSNQAVGAGLVHGFDVRLGSSDVLRVDGGLGLAPSGRVVYLPADTDLGIAELISRSRGDFDPGSPPSGGAADFAPCPPDEPGDLTTPVPPRPLYVLTAAAAEALCGEEERFGQLCEDACATDSDRSVAVEGVRFRVRELRLTLPTSRAVPFTGRHLRSRVASAFYEAERHAVPSMISGAGLRTTVWCAGADGIGGEEIPLAVFDRNGQVTSFVDQWTARRELVETSPQRYWQWRFAARPLDVFLAQVLQFQCQLVGLGTDGGSPVDPCADERAALEEVGQVLGTLTGPPPAEVGFLHAELPVADVAAHEGIGTISDTLRARLGELQSLVAGALTGNMRSLSGSVLIDLGIVETSSAGYLPVDPRHDVQPQVRAFMGPGVDLRFCVVRPDFVPEAFQEAQHMERISLTQGIDDPDRIEEVDVLVPGGTFEPRPAATGGFEGVLRVLPSRLGDGSTTTGSAIALQAVARDQVTDGWSWTLAAFGESADQAAVDNLASAMAREAGLADGGSDAIAVPIEPDAVHAADLADASLYLRRNREAVNARIRTERILGVAAEAPVAIDDLPLRADDRRPVAVWLDVETADALDDVAVGGRTAVRLRATLYSRAGKSPVLSDVQIHGNAIVVARQPVASGADVIVTTNLEGTVDPLVVVGGNVSDPNPSPIRQLELLWRIAVTASGTRIVAVTMRRGRSASVGAEFTDAGTPRHVEGFLGLFRDFQSGIDTTPWASIVDVSAVGSESRRLADVTLDEAEGVLDPGTPGRDLGNSVIDVIAGELEARGRGSGFKVLARRRLFPESGSSTGIVRARTDWVMFHRRRTKQCGTEDVPTPVAVRRFRWYHAVRTIESGDGGSELIRLRSLAGNWEAVGDTGAFAKVWDRFDQWGLEPVTAVEFEEGQTDLHSSVGALRTAWSTEPRGELMSEAMIATQGAGDGESVNLGRLHTATGAVGDLIDVTKTKTRVVQDVPPDLQADGIDGVIVTVGVVRAPVELDCAHVFRMDTVTWNRLMEVPSNFGTLADIVQFLEEFGVAEPVIARFQDDDLANTDEVESWWPGSPVEVAAIVVDQSVAGDAAVVDQWVGARTVALAAVLGFSDVITPDGFDLDLGDCQAVYFVQEVVPN